MDFSRRIRIGGKSGRAGMRLFNQLKFIVLARRVKHLEKIIEKATRAHYRKEFDKAHQIIRTEYGKIKRDNFWRWYWTR